MDNSRSGSSILEILEKKGPVPVTEVPISNLDTDNRRKAGTLSVTGGPGNIGSVGGGLTDVIYLIDEHDFRDVLVTWLEINEEAISEISAISLRYKIRGAVKKDQKDIVSDTLDELGYTVDRSDNGGDHATEFECTFCGESVPDIASHLPDCDQTG